MGSPAAPSIAKLFMATLEPSHICNPEIIPYYSHISYYSWYIDNVILLYDNKDSLVEFSEWLKKIHLAIIFFLKHHDWAIAFVDVVVYKDHKHKLAVHLDIKPTDKNSCLNYGSFHSIELRKNLVNFYR